MKKGRGLKSAAVLGVGGVGGCIAAVLAHQGIRVTCIVRENAVANLRENGLQLESSLYGDSTTKPEIVGNLTTAPDVLFIATKATSLESALNRVDAGQLENTVVIPLLNGLEHMQIIRAKLGSRVVAGSIRIVSELVKPGHVRHTSPFVIISVASDGDIKKGRLEALAGDLTALGLETKVYDREADVLWEKLVRLAALACTTSLSDRPIGFLREDPSWRLTLMTFIAEASAVAKAEGVVIDPVAQMAVIDGLPETLTSSMHRDIMAGRSSELDAIAGSIVRAGVKQGLKCPTIQDMIRRIEEKKG